MTRFLAASAAAFVLSLAACSGSGSTGNDMSGLSTGSVHGGDYTDSGTRNPHATAGQGDFNANTNGVNSSGGYSANSAGGLEGTGAASGH